MENRKINLDRPQLTANEIQAGKDFDTVLRNHQIMSKPFYKQNWFFGTTGLASLGLIIGGTLAFQGSSDAYESSDEMLHTEAPPNLTVPENNLFLIDGKTDKETHELAQKTILVNLENNTPIEETTTQTTLINNDTDAGEQLTENELVNPDEDSNTNMDLAEEVKGTDSNTSVESNERTGNPFLDMSPRISNKIGGSITRQELFDNKGITTEGDINVIHFELHLIDGLGGKVFAESGNQLNQEMKDALESVEQGETIYFENIRGQVKNGAEVRLNPLRYVLMN